MDDQIVEESLLLLCSVSSLVCLHNSLLAYSGGSHFIYPAKQLSIFNHTGTFNFLVVLALS